MFNFAVYSFFGYNRFMYMYKRFLVIFFSFLFINHGVFATHNRAGEITYKQISDLTFEITIWTYTYTLSAADRDQLPVNWGDGTTSIAPRVEKIALPSFYRRNKYVITHTFPGPGVYKINVEDPNRNYGILNIPNSVNVVFSIQTTLMINPSLGYNNTPVLLNPPYDKAARGRLFIHNPSAYDEDGDSLSYKLTVCTREDGIPIENYTLPPASDTLYVDAVSGDLIWQTPVDTGFYNVAIDIEEWRDGIKIGNIVRDIQIEVYETDNNPPVTEPLRDFCVVAGDSISYEITSTDAEGDSIRHVANGGPFIVDDSPAQFNTINSVPGSITSRFTWKTNCSHVRQQRYTVVVKAEDNNPDLELVDISSFNITVLGPPPENLTTISSSNSIRLEWSPGPCTNVKKYRIYRREGYFGFVPDSCQNGVPASTGYVSIGETSGPLDTVFIDNNDGSGLLQGTDYCYMVVGVYKDGCESIASNEICGVLIQGTPIITNVSVNITDPVNGSVYLAWVKPRDLDTIPANGPYEYMIYRSPGLWGESYSLIHTFQTSDLNDTTFTDILINTLDFAYTYKVELYNNEVGNRFLIGPPGEASTVFLHLEPGDNQLEIHCRKNVPWINTEYIVYRQNKTTMNFDSIGVSSDTVFIDTGLINSVTYCYFVKTVGSYNRSGLPEPLINYSHEACGVPIDNSPPCPPTLSVSSICDSLYNYLVWTNPNNYCADDVVSYNIYYKTELDDDLGIIATINSATDTTYRHYMENTLAGCYAVTAIDSFGNESSFSMPIICVDSCTYFEVPNVFTPNGDNINDILKAKVSPFIDKIDMKIYSRSGTLVYETNDPYINWDGRQKGKKSFVASGIYYYICDIYEQRITGIEIRNISGFVHVISEKGARISVE